MKSIPALIFLFFPLLLLSQLSIDESDMPDPGDTIRQSITINLGGYDFEEAGPDHTWDFSELVPFTQTVDTFVAVNETPFVYQILFFLTANMAQKQAEFAQFDGFQVTDSYRYFKNSSSSFREVGIGITLNGLPLPTLYDAPDIIYSFPVSVESHDSSLANYDFDIPFLGYYGGWKKRVNIADGWGTISTPFGTFEAIRLRSEIIQYDSLYIDSLGIGVPFYQSLTEYKWMAKGLGLPVCKVVDNGLIQTVTYIDSVRTILTVSDPVTTEAAFKLFPNPAGERIFLSFNIPAGERYHIDITNSIGEPVLSQNGIVGAGVQVLDLTPYSLSAGVYLVQVTCRGLPHVQKVIIR